MCSARLLITVIAIHLETLTFRHGPLCNAYQYYILGKNNDYKYGYRTDNGIVARQEADSANQVSGHYFYKDDNVGNFGMKYTSGVQGYQPQPLSSIYTFSEHPYPVGVQSGGTTFPNGYHYSFDTGNFKKEESGDPYGNKRGHFEYEDDAGRHDLSYIADDQGFRATGGNLACLPSFLSQRVARRTPQHPSGHLAYPFNGMWAYQSSQKFPNHALTPYFLIDSPSYFYSWPSGEARNRSYNFSFDTGNYRKEEMSDEDGNIRGYFEYEDDRGRHDLSYVSSDKTGFQVTGGSLANNFPYSGTAYRHYTNTAPGQQENPYAYSSFLDTLQNLSRYLSDLMNALYNLPYGGHKTRSYYFLFDTGSYKIEESSDASGNINGYLQHEDGIGYHDLSYVTNNKTGFRITGGNIASDIRRNFDRTSTEGPNVEGLPTPRNDEEIVFLIGETTMQPQPN